MIISHQVSGNKGAFIAKENNTIIGEMTYSVLDEHKIIIDHTEVAVEQKGKGVGKLLMDNLVAMARANAIKIIPLCPFAAAMFRKNPEIRDLLS